LHIVPFSSFFIAEDVVGLLDAVKLLCGLGFLALIGDLVWMALESEFPVG